MWSHAIYASLPKLPVGSDLAMPRMEFDLFRDVLIYAVVGAVLALLCWAIYAWPGGDDWDDRWSLRLNRVDLPGPVDAALRGVSHLGLFPVNGTIWLGIWLYVMSIIAREGAVFQDETPLFDQSATAAQLSWAFVWAAPYFIGGAFCFILWVTCRILKRRTSRPRPFERLAEDGVQQRGMLPSGSSFPSSHAAMVWYTWPLLVAVSFGLGWLPPSWPVAGAALLVAVALATLVSYTRVYLGAHFPRDVLAGTVLGLGFVFAAYMAGGRAVPWLYQLLF